MNSGDVGRGGDGRLAAGRRRGRRRRAREARGEALVILVVSDMRRASPGVRRSAARAPRAVSSSTGSWRNTTDALRQSACRNAGIAGDERAGLDRVAAPRSWRRSTAARRRVMCPVTPVCPAIIDVVADRRAAGDPDLRREQHARPIATPCATCTRLSIFVPAPIRVSPIAGRSIVEFAPISTSSSITTSPCCGIFRCVPSFCRANP